MAEPTIEYTLPGVLHYLQAEWRKFEREKNEWAIEKAEYKARIALLEGERRGIDNIKISLMKRVKMLEYALRQERKKALNETAESMAIDNSRESTVSEDGITQVDSSVDTKIKEKSREVLKSCLQEINYLTSLPTKLPLTTILSSRPPLHDRTHNRRTPPVPNNIHSIPANNIHTNSPVPANNIHTNSPVPANNIHTNSPVLNPSMANIRIQRPKGHKSGLNNDENMNVKEEEDVAVPVNVDEVAMMSNIKDMTEESMSKDIKLVNTDHVLAGDDMEIDSEYDNQSKLWKPRITIKGHLDSVRSTSFHPNEMIIASGSDDYTVKIWNLQKTIGKDGNTIKKALEEAELSVTYRGHTNIVTTVEISASQNRVYSSSLDSTIKVWRLPSEGISSTDPSSHIATYVGHTDAIWDFRLSTHTPLLGSASADGTVKIWDTEATNTLLKSTITYNNQTSDSIRNRVVPTSLDFDKVNYNQLLVSYSNAQIQLYDINTERTLLTFKGSDDSYDNTPSTQINYIITHPTESIVISAHEDKHIKLFDIRTGECIQSLSGHLDAVTSLDIDASGTTLVSGGHDASIRLWDISSRSCLQEFSAHRRKGDEGVLGVSFHPSYPWMVSGGADGIVKIYHHGP